MKTKRLFITSLAVLMCAAFICVGNAFADDVSLQETVYPDSFENSLVFEGGITDYAVYGDSYAFAYNGKLALIYSSESGERHADVVTESNITGLDYIDGKLYVAFSSSEYAVYPDLTTRYDLTDGLMQTASYMCDLDGDNYFANKKTGKMSVRTSDGDESEIETSGEFSKLKVYDDSVYAVLYADETYNLYKINGTSASLVELKYFDFSLTQYITCGGMMTELKEKDYVIKTATVKSGVYYTDVDLEETNGNYFALPSDKDVEDCTRAATDTLYCLVLAESGNASLIAINGKCYLTRKVDLTDATETTALTNTWTTGAYALDSIGIYSRPYESTATRIGTLESGTANAVTVLGQYEADGTTYAKIQYEEYGQTCTGYVLEGLLSPYSFAGEEKEQKTEEEEFVYDTNVTTVVLIIVIVLLVIIAVIYLMLVNSKKSKGKKTKKKSKRRKNDDDDDDDE